MWLQHSNRKYFSIGKRINRLDMRLVYGSIFFCLIFIVACNFFVQWVFLMHFMEAGISSSQRNDFECSIWLGYQLFVGISCIAYNFLSAFFRYLFWCFSVSVRRILEWTKVKLCGFRGKINQIKPFRHVFWELRNRKRIDLFDSF